MALEKIYLQSCKQLPVLFQRIAEGQAPGKFTNQHLKDIGFTSSTFRAVIPLLKSIGFLSNEGLPTSQYHEYRNKAHSKKIMAKALREAYSDLFTIKEKPTESDRALIEGKFMSVHNAPKNSAKLMANTFYSLLSLADLEDSSEPTQKAIENETSIPVKETRDANHPTLHKSTLHYNIQIHLPATKDIEVFNAIFKSLKEHLFE